jgi:hypothetical protein
LRHEGLVVRLVKDLRADMRLAAESRVTPQRAITKKRLRGMLGDTHEPEREAREA